MVEHIPSAKETSFPMTFQYVHLTFKMVKVIFSFACFQALSLSLSEREREGEMREREREMREQCLGLFRQCMR